MKRTNWATIIVILILIAAGALITLTPEGNVIKEAETIKIGAILDLSGPAVSDNNKIKQGMDLALEEINNQGGILGRELELVWEDDKCDAKEGANAYHKMMSLHSFPVIIGGSCSSVTLAIAPIAEENGVVLVSPYSSNPQLTYAGDYIFRTVPSDIFEGNLEAEFIAGDLKMRNIGILYVNNDYGKGLNDVITSRFEGLDGEVIISEAYETNAVDFRTQLTKIKSKNPKLIYIAGYQRALINILKQIREMGLTTQIMANSLMDDPEIIKEVGDAAEGVILGSIFFDPKDEFKERFRARYGEDPGTIEAAGYDTLKMVAEAIRRGGYSSDGIKSSLYRTDYNGALGHLTFDENGDIVWPRLSIKTIRDGQFVIYED